MEHPAQASPSAEPTVPADDPRSLRREIERLTAQPAEHAVIEQAKGVLAAWNGIDPDTAYDRLVTLSEHRELNVRELAAEIVGGLPEASRRAQRGLSPVPEPPEWARRAVIEQAKGVLAAWYGLDAAPAARRLVTLSEHRNLPLDELAEQIVAEGAGHVTPARTVGTPAPTPSPWLYRLVDALVDAAMVLIPVYEKGSGEHPALVTDLVIEHVNALVTDPYGRSADSLVGRRLAAAFPSLVPAGVYDAYLDALNADRPYRVERQGWAEKAAGTVRSGLTRLHAVPICGRLVVTWQEIPAD